MHKPVGTGADGLPEHQDALYRRLVDAIVDYAIYMIDADGIITSWNPGAERAKGYTRADIIGQKFARFFTQEDQSAGLPDRILAQARATGRYEGEGWRVRKDGTRFWASVIVDAVGDGQGTLIGFAKVTRDMTEQRAVQEVLRQSEQRLRLLMESVTQYSIFTLDPDGLITTWNAGAQRINGYVSAEILGRHFATFFTPEDRAQDKPAHALATARDTGRFEEEGWRVCKDGMRFWASVVLDAMRDDQGVLVGFAKVTQDITERRSLDETRAQLHQAQEMVAQLTGGVAHDFNNLLSVIMGSLQLISAKTSDPRVRRLADSATRATERGGKLTGQLLALSRRQVLRPQATNLNTLLAAAETLLWRVGGDAIVLTLDLEPELWLTDVDEAQFEASLLNLVINARDAMPEGGRLIVRTRNVIVDTEAAARLTEIVPGRYVVISVVDSGLGMSPAVRARATEPFYTTKETGRGSGLGLSQVHGFARQSHGQLELLSQWGSGTTAGLYLPQSASTPADRAMSQLSAQGKTGRGTVLVVEGDPDVLGIAIEAVESFGYRAHFARDAAAALLILRADPAVDLLFTNVVMPNGMSGVELAREAKLLVPALRVLLASGYPRDFLEGDAGVDRTMEFISKPYTLASLGQKLLTLAGGAPD